MKGGRGKRFLQKRIKEYKYYEGRNGEKGGQHLMEKSREGSAEGEGGQKHNAKDVSKSQSEAYQFTTYFKIYILRYYIFYNKNI